MFQSSKRTQLGFLIALPALAIMAEAANTPLASNLLTNPSFENGDQGWTTQVSAAQVIPYGTAGAPSTIVSQTISGDANLLRDLAGGAVLQQVVSLAGQPAGVNLCVGGFFGGSSVDDATFQVEFRDSSGLSLGLFTANYVTSANRNGEEVLMLRREILSIPSGAVDFAYRVILRNNSGGVRYGAADALFAEYCTDSIIPRPLPLNSELLVNPSFEQGYTLGSPLTLVDAQGWFGLNGSQCIVRPYSDTNPHVPTPHYAALAEAGGNLLSDLGGDAALRQTLDLRGNAQLPNPFHGQALLVSSLQGGSAFDDDRSRVDITFLDANSVPLAHTLGPVTRPERNLQTMLLLREDEYSLDIPSLTEFVQIDLVFENYNGGSRLGLADKLSVKLVEMTPDEPIPLNVNLISNPCFESGTFAGSPLEPFNTAGWVGINHSAVATVQYGLNSTVPPSSFAADHGLGSQLLQDVGGDGGLRQTFDLTSLATSIDMGLVSIDAKARLGGFSIYADTADLRIEFRSEHGNPTSGVHTLGQVTAAMRNNITSVLEQSANISVNPGSRSMIVELRFYNYNGGGRYGLADKIEVILRDASQPAATFCSGDGSGTPCPCSNSGIPGHGCANGTFAIGAHLVAHGNASVSDDSLVLLADRTVPYSLGLFFQGNTAEAGGAGLVFGDGLRCVGGGVRRLQTSPADGCGTARSTISISQVGNVTAGNLKRYQWWYRDAINSPCGNGFNLSNGYEVQWMP